MEINFQKIEKKWQRHWEKYRVFRTKNFSKKPKFYVLDMFPYPSGEGLHVGHLKGYIATDIIARMKKMQGFEVLHPMGWDAFGLPAENYALQYKIHPEKAVKKNIKIYKNQLLKIGPSYDWSREINTTDPEYYKWTQWTFLELFKKGLVYISFEPAYWCPSCKTGLALEDLEGRNCERCGALIEKKPLRQLVIKITEYAQRLLNDLKDLDWEDSIIEMQKNWIGRSVGSLIKFEIQSIKSKTPGKSQKLFAEVFTTRLDTIFGCAYLVFAPEHKIISELKSQISNFTEVEKYIKTVKDKTDLQRETEKEKTGLKLKGIKAVNPFNGKEVPVFIADYVLPFYGAGAIMAVPCHDKRDFEFAQKYNLEIIEVIIPKNQKKISSSEELNKSESENLEKVFIKDGVLINSGQFTGLDSEKAREKMVQWLEKNKLGRKAVYYKIRDWVFARQRYWGEPIPLVFCAECKKQAESLKFKVQSSKLRFNKGELLNPGWIALPVEDLPLRLPKVRYYQPTDTGESPLAGIKKWVETKCPKCGGPAKRETNTMPQWAGSCWYYLAYIMRDNSKFKIQNSKLYRYWLPVDLYVGGAEHATRHLIYARFWHKFLYDLKLVSVKEQFKKFRHVGLVLAEDGKKMSKRWKNVINPDEIIKHYGADALRLAEMFMGPFSQEIPWQSKNLIGIKRFIERISNLKPKFQKNPKIENLLHQTIKKVTEDIDNFKFNTAISQLMIFLNGAEKEKQISQKQYLIFIKLLAPFTPHLCEEIWQNYRQQDRVPPSSPNFWLRQNLSDLDRNSLYSKLSKFRSKKKKFKSIFEEDWPQYNPKLIKKEKINLIIQINGRKRDIMEIDISTTEAEAKQLAQKKEKIKKLLIGKEIKKIIFVAGRLINFVI